MANMLSGIRQSFEDGNNPFIWSVPLTYSFSCINSVYNKNTSALPSAFVLTFMSVVSSEEPGWSPQSIKSVVNNSRWYHIR